MIKFKDHGIYDALFRRGERERGRENFLQSANSAALFSSFIHYYKAVKRFTIHFTHSTVNRIHFKLTCPVENVSFQHVNAITFLESEQTKNAFAFFIFVPLSITIAITMLICCNREYY